MAGRSKARKAQVARTAEARPAHTKAVVGTAGVEARLARAVETAGASVKRVACQCIWHTHHSRTPDCSCSIPGCSGNLGGKCRTLGPSCLYLLPRVDCTCSEGGRQSTGQSGALTKLGDHRVIVTKVAEVVEVVVDRKDSCSVVAGRTRRILEVVAAEVSRRVGRKTAVGRTHQAAAVADRTIRAGRIVMPRADHRRAAVRAAS